MCLAGSGSGETLSNLTKVRVVLMLHENMTSVTCNSAPTTELLPEPKPGANFVMMGKNCQIENRNVECPYRPPNSMKTPLFLAQATLAGCLMISSALAGAPVVRTLVRDVHGKARIVYVRVADKRILYPRVVQQIAMPGGSVEFRPAVSSAYRPDYFPGCGVYRPDFGYGIYAIPGRRYYPVGTGYPDYYRPTGNYGVDAILYRGDRGKFGIPGYGRPGGAFPRPLVRPQPSGLPQPRYSGNSKEN